MKTLADWLLHLESLHPKGQSGIELGLERVCLVKAALQQTQHCPLVIVGGTNGKGSTCAYLEAIYTAAAYRVGCYTSPHLLEYNERVRVNRAPVDDAALCLAFAKVESARLKAGNVALTYFEFGTLAAWEVFAASGVDLIVLEVGLGGRLDAVNVYEPDCSMVTGVALDHTDWLGTTREAIGFEKAGIYRAGRVAICADPEPPQSLIDHAISIGADLKLIGHDFSFSADSTSWIYDGGEGSHYAGLPLPGLKGSCQLRNAAAVLALVDALQGKLPVPVEAIHQGLAGPQLAGRFQIIPGRPTIIFDVAHNPQAVAGLAENLAQMSAGEKTIAVVGMLADKDVQGALAMLAGRVDVWLLADLLDTPRGASAAQLAAALAGACLGGRVDCFASPLEAFTCAAKLAGENDRILVFGSFYTVAAVMRALKHGS